MITDKFEIKCLEINEKPGLERFLKHMPNLIKGLLDLTILKKHIGEDYLIINDNSNNGEKTMYFYEPSINVKKFIPKGYILIKNKELHKYKFIDWIYFSSKLRKDYKNIIFDIKTNMNNWVIASEKLKLITNKYLLHITIKKENPDLYKKYFIDKIKINKEEDLDNFMVKGRYYILKPIPGSSGLGIKMVDSKKKALNYINNFKFSKNELKKIIKLKKKNKIDYWIIQQYIENPLLLNKRKFHLRVLVLFLNLNKERKLYIYDEFMVIPALKEFNLNSNNKNIHNSHGKPYNDKEIYNFYLMYKKNISLKERKNIKLQIIDLMKGLKKYISGTCYVKNENCYQFLGLDIMIDENYKVKILELNLRPGSGGQYYFPNIYKGLIDLTLLRKDKASNYIEI